MASKKKYYERKQNGLCVSCGKSDELTQSGHSYCFDCLERMANYRQESWRRNLEKNRQYHRSRYKERKENGLCPHCGKQIDNPKYILCSRCRSINTRSKNYYHDNQPGYIPPGKRNYCGLCVKCSAPLPDPPIIKKTDGLPSKLCERCYKDACKGFGAAVKAIGGVHEWHYTNRIFFPNKKE